MFKELNSKRLKFIPLDKNGLDDMYEYSKKPEMYKYLEFGPHETKKETEAYLQKLLDRCKSKNNYYWFICLRDTKKIIGTFGIINIDWRKLDAEFGYGISPDYWNKGYFKEALRCMLDYLFIEKKFHRVFVKTQADNYPSIHGLKNVGFKEEGTMREYYSTFAGNLGVKQRYEKSMKNHSKKECAVTQQ